MANKNPELHPENLTDKKRFAKNDERTKELASKGGRCKKEKEDRRKTLKECFEILLSKKRTVSGVEMTGVEALVLSIYTKAIRGDVQAAKYIREVIGEDPSQKLEISGAPEFGGSFQINIMESKREDQKHEKEQ